VSEALTSDFLRPARLRAEQERLLGAYLVREVRPFSDHYSNILGRASWDGRKPELADLQQLPVTEPEQLGDPAALVLRPDRDRLVRSGLGSKIRVQIAELLGGLDLFGRSRIDPVYKPVHWTVDEGLLMASSAADTDRLAEIGRRWLEAAGVRPTDSLVSFVEPGPSLGFWELQLGAKRAGLSALFLPSAPTVGELLALRPNVVAGSVDDLLRLLMGVRGEGGDLHSLHTVLVVGEPLSTRDRRLLADLAPRAVVLQAWAPPGVRSLWFECRGVTGLHTQPGAELIEVVVPPDDRPAAPNQYGDLLWTAIGWRGSVALRLRTGLLGSLDRTVCTSCGRGSPRIRVPAFIEVMEGAEDVAEWQVELSSGSDRRDEIVVYLAPSGRVTDHRSQALVQGLADRMSAAGERVQFVIEPLAELRTRLAETGDARLLDLRE
jgi:hypothetical protein